MTADTMTADTHNSGSRSQAERASAPAPRQRGPSAAIRGLIAGPLVLACSVLVMAGMPIYLPAGAGGADHIAFSVLLFPLIWAALFFYAIMEKRQWRSAVILIVLSGLNAIPVVAALRAMTPSS